MYQIYYIDGGERCNVGKPYKSITKARRRVDVLDNAYGAYRYRVKRIDDAKDVSY